MKSSHSFLRSIIALGLLLLAVAPNTSAQQSGKVLTVRCDPWMPYNGEPGADKPGYAVEVLQTIFEAEGIKIDYQTMPYTEALDAAREGKVGAVIGANEKEGHGLLFPKLPIGEPQVCLLTRAKDNIEWQSIRTLSGKKLGVIKGYSYWDGLDSYIAHSKDIVSEEGDAPLDVLFAKLESGEISVLAETEPVLLWHLRTTKKDRNDFKAIYKHVPDPIFVAFSNDEQGKSYCALFDKGLKSLRTSGALAKILAKYGMKDWN